LFKIALQHCTENVLHRYSTTRFPIWHWEEIKNKIFLMTKKIHIDVGLEKPFLQMNFEGVNLGSKIALQKSVVIFRNSARSWARIWWNYKCGLFPKFLIKVHDNKWIHRTIIDRWWKLKQTVPNLVDESKYEILFQITKKINF
jgi:hypothetical protein